MTHAYGKTIFGPTFQPDRPPPPVPEPRTPAPPKTTLCLVCGTKKTRDAYARYSQVCDECVGVAYVCKVEGCEKPPKRGRRYGECEMHAARRKLRGSYDAPIYKGFTPAQYTRQKHSGFTPSIYEMYRVQQGGRCAICGKHESELPRALSADHNHATSNPRGLLCNRCNMGLGSFQDNPELLKAALKYITSRK